MLLSDALASPQHLPAEVANVLRRRSLESEITQEVATAAYFDFLALTLELYPYFPLAQRIWQLRHSVTTYDAWYVALAEALDSPLATQDLRLTRAPGPRCRFLTP